MLLHIRPGHLEIYEIFLFDASKLWASYVAQQALWLQMGWLCSKILFALSISQVWGELSLLTSAMNFCLVVPALQRFDAVGSRDTTTWPYRLFQITAPSDVNLADSVHIASLKPADHGLSLCRYRELWTWVKSLLKIPIPGFKPWLVLLASKSGEGLLPLSNVMVWWKDSTVQAFR